MTAHSYSKLVLFNKFMAFCSRIIYSRWYNIISKYLAFYIFTLFNGKYLVNTGNSYCVLASYSVFRRCSFSGVILTNPVNVSVKFYINKCLQNGAYPSTKSYSV